MANFHDVQFFVLKLFSKGYGIWYKKSTMLLRHRDVVDCDMSGFGRSATTTDDRQSVTRDFTYAQLTDMTGALT